MQTVMQGNNKMIIDNIFLLSAAMNESTQGSKEPVDINNVQNLL